MADTERDTTAILALWADNTTKKISPQDGRDLIVSVLGGYGSIREDNGSTPQTVNSTSAVFGGWKTNGPSSTSVTPDKDNQRITVAVAAVYEVTFTMDYTATAGTFVFSLAVNDVVSDIESRTSSDATARLRAGFTDLITLALNDVVTVEASADVDGRSVTPLSRQLMLKRVG